MRFTFVILAIAGLSMAASPIPAGGTCKKDGSMGNCQSGLCVQKANAATGKCK
ncbi:hypothetical protein PENSTE_c013G05588 [Penicillium steckii]|uniref:Uncharacterized protein n=1 Tax=Penicillium steckii TaxID=303698 RepID=A0A1V6T2P7_9EURO|nr:hypothetical protein PENSTE_c013G05588 [Penicillium steckii]